MPEHNYKTAHLADQVATLEEAPELWRSPTTAADRSGDPLRQDRRDANGEIAGQIRLADQVAAELWPTPQAHDAAAGQAERMFRLNGAGNRNLNDFTAMVEERLWNTPTAHNMKNDALPPSHQAWGDTLPGDVLREMWATPRTSDANGAGQHGTGGMDLRTQIHAEMWMTPTRVTGEHPGRVLVKEGQQDCLSAQVNRADSTRPALNPPWVEMLQGFPENWTSLD